MPNSTWIEDTQPYIKSYAMFHHPKGPDFSDSDAQVVLKRRQSYGAPTRFSGRTTAITGSGTAKDAYSTSNGVVTGGSATYLMDGTFGFGTDTGAAVGTRVPTPSLSQTSIDHISDNIMISDSTRWDDTWSITSGGEVFNLYASCQGFTTVANSCLYPTSGALWAGPRPTKLVKSQSYQAGPTYYYPSGYVTYVASDGHAAVGELYNDIYSGVQGTGGQFYSKHFWPRSY